MNFWCKILGHTWMPDTTPADVHWHTTKKGEVLVAEGPEDAVRYYDRCIRCGDRREVPVPATEIREVAGRAAALVSEEANETGGDGEESAA